MASKPALFELNGIDMDRVEAGAEDIEAINPHRGVMRMLDGVISVNMDNGDAVAFKDVRGDEFWVPGHIPGRPIFPGVLMIEAAAQLASYVFLRRRPAGAFLGFAGVDDVKFRGMVAPGDRLILLHRQIEVRDRRCIALTQGYVGENLVYEGRITGMPM